MRIGGCERGVEGWCSDRGDGDKGWTAREEDRKSRSRSNKAGGGQDDTDRDLTIHPRYIIHESGGLFYWDGRCAGRPTISLQAIRLDFASIYYDFAHHISSFDSTLSVQSFRHRSLLSLGRADSVEADSIDSSKNHVDNPRLTARFHRRTESCTSAHAEVGVSIVSPSWLTDIPRKSHQLLNATAILVKVDSSE